MRSAKLFSSESPEDERNTPSSSANRASKFLEAIFAFFQYCLVHKLIIGVNVEERTFYGDCYYLINTKEESEDEDSLIFSFKDDVISKHYLDIAEYLKSRLEIKDRRVGVRTFHRCFVLSEARLLLEKKKISDTASVFDKLRSEGLITCCGPSELFQFVARIHHNGFVYVTPNAATTPNRGQVWTKRWLVLRENSLLFFNEQKRQLISEVPMSIATVIADDRSSHQGSSDNVGYHWTITTPTERVYLTNHSLVERDTWLGLLVPLNTIVGEENEILEQCEAIITSTSFWINNI